MDLYQLNHFIVLAKTLNFTNASEQLFISQPTLSRSIATLEQEIGVQLFERTRQAVKLTEYGAIFYPYAEQVLRDYNKGLTITRDALSNKQGRITIGIYNWGFEEFLPVFLDRVQKEMPALAIKCIDGTTPNLLSYLKEGKIDIALTTIRQKNKWTDLSATQIFESDIQLVVSKDNPLSRKDFVSIDDLRSEHFFHLDPTAIFTPPLGDIVKDENCDLEESRVTSIGNLRTLLTLVSHNLGVAMLHRRDNILNEHPSIAAVPLVWDAANPDETHYTMSGYYVYHPMNTNPNIPGICKIISSIAPDFLPPFYS